MTDRIWLKHYPQGVPAEIKPEAYTSLVALMEESFQKYAKRVAYSFMGKEVTYAQTDSLSRAMGVYLQSLGLAKGDRVAIMLPNVPQYPVAVAAILRAGYVVVNVTRCTPRVSWSTSSRTRAPKPSSSSRTLPTRWSRCWPTPPSNTW